MYADTYTFIGPGDWTNDAHWDVYPGESIQLGDTVYIIGNCEMISEIIFENYGYINVTSTGALVPGFGEEQFGGGILFNYNKIVNNGLLQKLYVENNLEFINNNLMIDQCAIDNVNPQATIENNGSMEGEGIINIFNGMMTNSSSGFIKGYFLANFESFENYGIIDSEIGILQSWITNDGLFLNEGTLNDIGIQNGSGDFENVGTGEIYIYFLENSTTFTNTGYVENNGDAINDAVINNMNTFINNGTYSGMGQFIGDMINNGEILPGNSPGITTITGDLTNSAGSIIEIEIADLATGGTAGVDYDQLIITGNALLEGTLSLVNFTGFNPAIGESYPVILYGTLDPASTLIFDFALFPLTFDRTWIIEYTDTGINVIVESTLPVELTKFEAQKLGSKVELEWTTATEVNNKGFHVERSENGKEWNALSFVVGEGTSLVFKDYAFTDERPNQGMNYYRLMQEDYDGAIEYSNIQVVVFKNDFKISPNPSSSFITVNDSSASAYEIFNMNGKRIMEGETENGRIEISVLEQGIYILNISDQIIRFVKI